MFEYGLAVLTEYKSKAFRIAADLFGSLSEPGSGRTYQSVQPLGLIARPRDPDTDPTTGQPSKGAGVLFFRQGEEGFAIPTTDPRILDKIPEQKKGGTCLYAAPGSIINIDGEHGSLSILVPYANATKTMSINVSVNEAGEENIQIRHGDGHGIQIDGAGNVNMCNRANDASITINDDGIVLNGNVTLNGGAVLGTPTGGVPVALAPEVTSMLAALNAALISGLNVSGPKATLASPIVVDVSGSTQVAASK